MIRCFIFLFIVIISFRSFPQTWTKSDQPDGGMFVAMDVSPLDSSKIVVLCRYFQKIFVYYSSDEGKNWDKIGEFNKKK